MKVNLVCYCFNYSEEDIINDIRENKGTSTIMEKILSEKKRGRCSCSDTHPKGR